ncbi:Gmad2 immunoglobulin-like domain-containing protein [Nocardioides sp.]|uniref:Gmad2 immunoglobulin-like domain-containing protein n=1 Tax=Nocardioides sp. TaxID=35761 RepID=UPI0035B15D9D
MGLITEVRVRQPAKHDLVARKFVVAGVGNGFEGTIGIRVLDSRGRVLAEDSAQSAGGMAGVGEFATRVTVPNPPRDGTRLTVQVFGDNPGLPDEGPSPGFNTQEVEVIMFAELRGWLLYRVEAGDTLTSIVRKLRPFTRTTVAQVVAANPRITDPDVIRVGQRLRVPQKD